MKLGLLPEDDLVAAGTLFLFSASFRSAKWTDLNKVLLTSCPSDLIEKVFAMTFIMTRHVFLPLLSTFALAIPCPAAMFVWGAGGVGMSGSWDAGFSTNWWNGTANFAWPATSSGDDDASFPAPAGVVTISGAITANDLTFPADGYSIVGGSLTLDGTTPTIFTAAGVAAEFSCNLICPTGFRKSGEGTLVISGTLNSGTDITITGGSVDFAASSSQRFVVTQDGSTIITGAGSAVFRGEFVIDTSGVDTDTGMIWTFANVSQKSFDATFRVAGFQADPNGYVWTKAQGSRTWVFDERSGELTLEVPNTPFEDWSSARISGVEPTADESPMADPDGDGVVNICEFALNGDPLDPGDRGFHAGQTLPVPEIGSALTLTFATRSGTTFTNHQATREGLAYQVQGSFDLADFTSPVAEVFPAVIPEGWPAAGLGYEYHTFRLVDSPGSTRRGFLRIAVSEVPIP